jgi:hypothetical protein
MSMKAEFMEKQLKRIIQDPEGRKLLFAYTGKRFIDPNDPAPFVQICVPSNRVIAHKVLHAIEQMQAYSRQYCNVYAPIIHGHSLLPWVRNEMITRVIRDGRPTSHVLFIDDDIAPEPDALVKLLSHGKDIVAALCVGRNEDCKPNIRAWNPATGELMEMVKWNHGELIEVGGVGTGVMLISAKAIEKIGDFYLDCGYERFMGLGPEERLQELSKQRRANFAISQDAKWFQLLPTPEAGGQHGNPEHGEDMAFCLKARLSGVPVFVDTTVNPVHYGEYGWSLADYAAISKQKYEESKAAGEVKALVPSPVEEEEIQVVG